MRLCNGYTRNKQCAARPSKKSCRLHNGETSRKILPIHADPELALAYYNRAQAYFGSGQFDAAKKDYDQAVSLEPESILFYTQRGNAYLALGEKK